MSVKFDTGTGTFRIKIAVLRIRDLGCSAFWPMNPGYGMEINLDLGSEIRINIPDNIF
jgi:hypothetical protein